MKEAREQLRTCVPIDMVYLLHSLFQTPVYDFFFFFWVNSAFEISWNMVVELRAYLYPCFHPFSFRATIVCHSCTDIAVLLLHLAIYLS